MPTEEEKREFGRRSGRLGQRADREIAAQWKVRGMTVEGRNKTKTITKQLAFVKNNGMNRPVQRIKCVKSNSVNGRDSKEVNCAQQQQHQRSWSYARGRRRLWFDFRFGVPLTRS